MIIAQIMDAHGHPLKKQGRSWGGSFCPKCGAGSAQSNKFCAWVGRDHKERWFCHACGARGDVADLMALLEAIPLAEALRRQRAAESAGVSPAPIVEQALRKHEPNPALFREVARDLLQRLPMWEPEAAQYLQHRGISREVIVQAAHRGIVRMLPANPQRARDLYLEAARGASRLARAGLWAGSSDRWPANVFRPLLFFSADCSTVEFRSIDRDSRYPKAIRQGLLTKPFVWATDNKTQVVVVEGVIDMLSLVEMGERRTIMALPGVSSWRLEWSLAAHKAYGTRFIVGFDADDPGQKMAKRLIEALRSHGVEADRLEPPAKDWNESLQMCLVP